jgi:hypothetical protein
VKLRHSVFSIVFALLPLGGIAGHSLSLQSPAVSDNLSQTEAKERVKSAHLSSETPQHQLSKKELKALVANARTAKGQQNLATYFERQSQIFDEKSREYHAGCVLAAEHPLNLKTKYPSAYGDCQFWQQYYWAKSRKPENEAKLHQQLAIRLAGEKQ